MNRGMNIKRIRLIQRIILFLLVTIALLYICSRIYYSKEGFECNTRDDMDSGITTYLCDNKNDAEDKLTNGIPSDITKFDICYNVSIDSNLPKQYVCYNRPGPRIYDDTTASYRSYDNLGDNDVSPIIEQQTKTNYCNSYINSFNSFQNAYENTMKFQSSVTHIDISSIKSIVYHLSNASTTYCPKAGANTNICTTLKGGITDFTTMRDDPSPNTINAISTNLGRSLSTMKQYIYHDLVPMFIDSGCINDADMDALRAKQIF